MSNMISVASGFQYSVNIGYDFGNDNKLRNFIPTKSALSLLEDILLSTNPSSSDRARVLIGAYGKGKSHIVLTILSILMHRDLALFEKLMPKVMAKPSLYQLVQNYYDNDTKILPVVITGSSTSLTQAFLVSLQHTLSEYDLLGAMPDTNYRAAITVIKRWEQDFPETFEKFSEMIDEPTDVFIDKLAGFDNVAYETFERAYPTLTSGSLFNPFLGFDVVELYESVAKSLRSKGYSGIYVIYDEFSKFLEANITEASVSDTKMLQDFAEKCTRSGELQLHLMLISHKEIANYIDKLPKEKVDGWRGVSERFRHVHLNNNFSQTYEIISSVIQHHDPQWCEFCRSHENDFNVLYSRYAKHQMFIDAQSEIDTAVKGCYPLHPVSTFILPRLSERVAQNERTLFTFLSSEGTATLMSFLQKYNDEGFAMVTPDLIYDYFEPLFKKEAYAGDIHTTFVLTSTILNQLPEDSLGSKIVKTLSLIYILEQFERLSPTKEQIIGIYASTYSVEQIEETIRDLIEKEFVVYIKRSNDYLRLKKTSGVDIRQKISDLMEYQAGRIEPKNVLNASNFDNYMFPARYNDSHEMIRYFAFRFISSEEVTVDTGWSKKSEDIDADGIIYGIIPEKGVNLAAVQRILKSTSKDEKRHIFVLPKHEKPIDDIILEYSAVTKLRDDAEGDPILFDEYEVVYEDLKEVINNYIAAFTHPERYEAVYIHEGRKVDIQRKSSLTELMSKICDDVFGLTPIINNEAVNKNEITSAALNSRNKIISALLRSELEPSLGLTGTGQDVSIMRSTLIRTGIWQESENGQSIDLHPKDQRMENLLAVIEGFILEARQRERLSFRTLYDRLTLPSHHIGLRLGLIPIYLAVVLHQYRQQTVIHDRFGPTTTTVDTLLQINAEPDNYTLEYLDWNAEKESYVLRLAEAFSSNVVEAEKTGNSYDYVANAMRRWYMALPKYAKGSKKHPSGEVIAKRQLNMLKLLRQSLGGSELLFKKLPETFGYTEFSSEAAEEIIGAKKVFDDLLNEMKEYLSSEIYSRFAVKGSNKKSSLTSVLKEWGESLDPKSLEQLFSDGTDRFLQLINTATNDEDALISRMAKMSTGLRLEDWDDKTLRAFFKAIEQYQKTAKDFHGSVVTETINDTSTYQVTFADEDGKSTTKRFDKVEISSKGKLLFNQITSSLEAMGHSITEQEKRQILMEVLKKLC